MNFRQKKAGYAGILSKTFTPDNSSQTSSHCHPTTLAKNYLLHH